MALLRVCVQSGRHSLAAAGCAGSGCSLWQGPSGLRVSRAARFALSRMVAIEVRVFRSRIKGRGEDVGAASPESWGGFYVAEGPTDGLELLFANL